jgi:hypothetical protein
MLDAPKGFEILTYEKALPEIEKYHSKGAEPGVYLGFECLNPYYTMKLGCSTEWTGFPQSGKSQLLMNLLYYTSKEYGWKHLVYAPDIGEYLEIIEILIHIHTGKTMDKKYKANYISWEEILKVSNWLFEHFLILEPNKDEDEASLSPIDFWKYACKLDVQTATIDSWKDMFHDYAKYGGNYAMYLSAVLSKRNKLMSVYKKHFHTVIHPKQPRRNKDGQLQHPDTDDMEGGAQWNNSGKSILSTHRATFDTRIVDINILKAKPKIVGQRGICSLEFDPARGTYFERDEAGRSYYIGELRERGKQKENKLTNYWNEGDEPPF